MNEFALINRYFRSLAQNDESVIVGSGDDAAVVKIPQGYQMAVSTDALVSGVHFLPKWHPGEIAYKAIAVNVSDMAAMGAEPKWVTIALSLPEIDIAWVAAFSEGLAGALKQYGILLVGGDLTRGPLNIAVTIQGLLPDGQALRRDAAKVGDSVYVTGCLGGAALAVEHLEDETLNERDFNSVLNLLKHPIARVKHGAVLLNFAHAAIDLSDGLSADLNHVCQASGVGACLYREQIPVHPAVLNAYGDKAVEFALSGGDDYELCFTVGSSKKSGFEAAMRQSQLAYHEIGIIDEVCSLRLFDETTNKINIIEAQGFQHFYG